MIKLTVINRVDVCISWQKNWAARLILLKNTVIIVVSTCARYPGFPCAGAMSGGGSRVSKGRMKSSIPSDVSPAELKAMETELAQLEKKAPVGFVAPCYA